MTSLFRLLRAPRHAAAALALLALLPTLHALAPDPPAPHIPDVHVLSFSGDRVDLPAMLEGKVAILVLGFSKGARAQATQWGRRLPTDYFYSPSVLYFEMPVLASIPKLLRPAVLHSIKSEVSARSQPHFAPLTSDEPRWRSLVHYSHPDDAYVLLVDSKGSIRAQFQGEPTDAAYQALKARVDQLTASQPPR